MKTLQVSLPCATTLLMLSYRTWEAMTRSLSYLAPSPVVNAFIQTSKRSQKTKPCATGWNQWNLRFSGVLKTMTMNFHRMNEVKNEVKRSFNDLAWLLFDTKVSIYCHCQVIGMRVQRFRKGFTILQCVC